MLLIGNIEIGKEYGLNFCATIVLTMTENTYARFCCSCTNTSSSTLRIT